MRNFRTEKELKDKLVGRIKFQIVVDLKCFDIVSPAKIPDKNAVMLLYLSLSCRNVITLTDYIRTSYFGQF